MGKHAVAIVTPRFPPELGGVEAYAQAVARAVAEDHDLAPVVIATGSTPGTTIQEGIPVIRLPIQATLSNTPISLRWPSMLRAIYDEYDIKLVTAHAPVVFLADIALSVRGIRPGVLTYHSGTMVKKPHQGGSLRARLRRAQRDPVGKAVDTGLQTYERLVLPRIMHRAQVVVRSSQTALGSDHPHARVINPGVDVNRFVPSEDRRVPGQLLYVGRLESTSAWKGVRSLVRALALLPDHRLRLVGDGDDVPDLRRLAAELGLLDRVEFAGALLGDDLVRAYQEAQLTVLPSLTNAESFGMVLVESMACGTPVVGTTVGGIPFVIGDQQAGRLVMPDQPEQLASAVAELSQSTRWAEASRNARERAVGCFDWEAKLAEHLKLYRELLGLPSSSA